MDGASQDAVSTFQPSLAVVIGVLFIMCFFTFILLVYAKFCHRRASDSPNNFVLLRSGSTCSGIDQTVIQSLPVFRFSSLKGSKQGLECAVCLSKFEDIEVLRLLPKCRHAFHINCVDKWLEKHSSCPLCRRTVSEDDINCSNSMRFLANQSELFIQREESRPNSSRFSSSRKIEKAISTLSSSFNSLLRTGSTAVCTDEEALIEEEEGVFDKYNHRIVVSEFVFNGRWSSVSCSDLMFLSSELINDVSSYRFDSEKMTKIEEMDIKRLFGDRNPIGSDPSTSNSGRISGERRPSSVNSGERRSVSEITGLSRLGGRIKKKERLRSIWLRETELNGFMK